MAVRRYPRSPSRRHHRPARTSPGAIPLTIGRGYRRQCGRDRGRAGRTGDKLVPHPGRHRPRRPRVRARRRDLALPAVRLPGGEYIGPDPDGYIKRDEIVDHFQRWVESFRAPVREGCPVTALDRDGDGFVLTVPGGTLRARTVVVATGGYQRAHRPPAAEQMPARLNQLLAEEYRNEGALPEGAVLVIGGGQTGCQMSEELHHAGRKVFLSCGRAPWAPRRMGGHDLVWWIVESGFWNRIPAQLPSPAARLLSNPLTTGHDGGHDLHFRTLHEMGVELFGRFLGAEDGTVRFGDDLAQSMQAGDDLSRLFMKSVGALCEKHGLEIPWEVPEAANLRSRTELDLEREGVTTVIR